MPSRDRTSEFRSAVEASRKRRGIGQSSAAYQHEGATESLLQKERTRSQFSIAASGIFRDLRGTNQRLEKMTQLVQNKSLFADKTDDINKLTFVIKEDIRRLKDDIETLQKYSEKQKRESGGTMKHNHDCEVVRQLNDNLMTATKDFKIILETRTNNLKVQSDRRNVLGSNFNGQRSSGNPKPAMFAAPPPSGQAGLPRPGGLQGGPEVAFSEPPSFDQSQIVMQNDRYLAQRADAVQEVESHIVELGQIFNKLGDMVAEQGEVIERIDTNIEASHANVQQGQNELLKYYDSVSSNRMLILKIFAILVFFIILFVFLS